MNQTTPEVIVVTGETAGIDRATAQQFTKCGARIALLAKDEERLEANRLKVEQFGGNNRHH
jgi:NADP-dependent 3-hydroxy acid dehydrogenase YdfG